MKIHLIRIVLLIMLSGAKFSQAQEPRLVIPFGHTWRIDNAVSSPSGNEIMTISAREIKIWEKNTGRLLSNIPPHPDFISSVEFSPSGKKVLTNSSDGTRVFDVFTGNLLFHITKPSVWKTSWSAYSAFSRDGSNIITLSNTDIRISNADDGKLLNKKKGFKSPDNVPKSMLYVEFSRDKKRAVQLFQDTTVVWDLESFTPVCGFPGIMSIVNIFNPHWKNCIRFSNNSRYLAFSYKTNQIDVLDLNNLKNSVKLAGHRQRINALTFSADDSQLLSASADSTAIVWDLQHGNKPLSVLKGHLGPVSYVDISRKSDYIITSSYDKTAIIWKSGQHEPVNIYKGHSKALPVARFIDDTRFITTSEDRTALIRDQFDNTYNIRLSGITLAIRSVDYQSTNKEIMVNTDDYRTLIIDRKTATLKADISARLGYTNKSYYNPVKPQILSLSGLYNETDGSLIRDSGGIGSYVFTYAEFSNDGKMCMTLQGDNSARIYNTDNGALMYRFRHNKFLRYATFSHDNDKLITVCSNDSIRIWDIKSGKQLYGFKPRGIWATTFEFAKSSVNPHQLIANSNDDALAIYDYTTGKVVKKLKSIQNGYLITGMDYSPSRNLILLHRGDGSIIFYDGNSLNKTFEKQEHKNLMASAKFIENGNELITASVDNAIKIWDMAAAKSLVTVAIVDSVNYFSQIPGGFYKCTPGAAKLLHYITPDLKVVTFEQLDVKYNRPDLVLQALGNRDATLVRSYYRAWQKRIKTLGVDTTAFRSGYSVPVADFQNRKTIQYEQKQSFLKLHVRGSDAQYSLDRYNIWFNEVPFFGQRGQTLRKGNTRILDTVITVPLSFGENRIEMSVMNTNGTESYRMPLFVKYTPEKPVQSKVYFIGIGMDRFADASYNLSYSSKDIRDLAVALKKRYGDTLETDTLFNENVSGESVAALKLKLQKTTVNDKVIVAYSGHGLLSKELDYYLSTYQVDFVHPEKNGLPYEALENLLDSIPARQKLMLIDACHSGEVDKEEGLQMAAVADSLGLARGAVVSNADTTTKHLGLGNSFELMRELFVNVGKGTGATIISASGGTQFALEKGDLKNGVFTFSILEAMNNNPTMLVSQLKSTVGKRVVELTGGMQKPTSRNEIINSDWRLW